MINSFIFRRFAVPVLTASVYLFELRFLLCATPLSFLTLGYRATRHLKAIVPTRLHRAVLLARSYSGYVTLELRYCGSARANAHLFCAGVQPWTCHSERPTLEQLCLRDSGHPALELPYESSVTRCIQPWSCTTCVSRSIQPWDCPTSASRGVPLGTAQLHM